MNMKLMEKFWDIEKSQKQAKDDSQLTFTFSNSKIETLKKGVKYGQS